MPEADHKQRPRCLLISLWNLRSCTLVSMPRFLKKNILISFHPSCSVFTLKFLLLDDNLGVFDEVFWSPSVWIFAIFWYDMMPCVGILVLFCSSLCGSVYVYHHHLKRKQTTHTVVRENGEDESRLFCYAAVGRMVDMDSSKYGCQRLPDLGYLVQYSASVNKYGDEWTQAWVSAKMAKKASDST